MAINWKQIWSEKKCHEGGMGRKLIDCLKAHGIRACTCESPYAGCIGIMVDEKKSRSAMKVICKLHGYKT